MRSWRGQEQGAQGAGHFRTKQDRAQGSRAADGIRRMCSAGLAAPVLPWRPGHCTGCGAFFAQGDEQPHQVRAGVTLARPGPRCRAARSHYRSRGSHEVRVKFRIPMSGVTCSVDRIWPGHGGAALGADAIRPGHDRAARGVGALWRDVFGGRMLCGCAVAWCVRGPHGVRARRGVAGAGPHGVRM
jgi:hypothetical protein